MIWASWRRFRYDRKCLFSCIYNPQITVSPTSSFSASFNGNRVKNRWTCSLTVKVVWGPHKNRSNTRNKYCCSSNTSVYCRRGVGQFLVDFYVLSPTQGYLRTNRTFTLTPHRVTSGRITQSQLLHTGSPTQGHLRTNHKFIVTPYQSKRKSSKHKQNWPTVLHRLQSAANKINPKSLYLRYTYLQAIIWGVFSVKAKYKW